MSATTISLFVCALLIVGALTGTLLRYLLPERYLDSHVKDVVRLGCGLIATISGLVLGLLINSAKTTYDAERDEIRQLVSGVASLDHQLEQYGAEARTARVELRKAVPALIEKIWHGGASPSNHKPFTSTLSGVATYQAIVSLAPASELQRRYQSQAIQTADAILKTRLVLYDQATTRMPTPFLVVLVFWLCILFASFNLFSPFSPTAFAAIVLIALSASGAIFLILELYHPFSGMMQIDSEPLRQVLAPLGA